MAHFYVLETSEYGTHCLHETRGLGHAQALAWNILQERIKFMADEGIDEPITVSELDGIGIPACSVLIVQLDPLPADCTRVEMDDGLHYIVKTFNDNSVSYEHNSVNVWRLCDRKI